MCDVSPDNFFEVERKTAFTKGAYHLTEKKGWGVESIIILVSDLLGYRRSATPLRFEPKKGANFCSAPSGREIGKW